MIIPAGLKIPTDHPESDDWFSGFERGWNERQEDWEKLKKKIIDKVLHSSDSVVKQARAGVPEDKIKKDFIKFMESL